jgi:invasion protein IalB
MEDCMITLNKSLLLALGLGLSMAGPVFAQEATAPADGTVTAQEADGASGDLSLGSEVTAPDGPGTTYTAATFDSWEQRCMRTEDGADPCQLYQLLRDGEGNNVAEISLFALPPGQSAVAGATIVAPLETLLTEQLTIAVDGANPKRYPFTWCAPLGCVARVGFTQAEVDSFKRGAAATVSIVPAAAPDQRVSLNLSLKGFTAGFDAVSKVSPE